METITTMTVNENGNVNVETLKNSDNMENQAGTISKNEVLENARKILMEKRKYLSDNADADTNIVKAAKTNVAKAEKDYAVALHDVKLPTISVEFWQVEESTEEKEVISKRKEDIINRQNGKAGNVYVISNLGSFGDDVFKVGMTRRLEPMDRVRELGDASVPFSFDVHAMIFSEDAVSLEKKLHDELNEYRLNKVNLRKEFFKLPLDQIEKFVLDNDPAASFNRTMLAEQYRQSLSMN